MFWWGWQRAHKEEAWWGDHEEHPPLRKPTVSFRAPFYCQSIQLERYQEPRRRLVGSTVQETVPVLTLRNKTCLFGFLVTLCQFAMMDPYNVLPAGTIAYSILLGIAIELILTPDDEMFLVSWPWEDQQRAAWEHQRRKEWEEAYEAARFEYHVLRNRPKTRIVEIEEDGKTVLYAI